MMNILMMMYVMLLFIQARGAESDEAREARQTQDRIHTAEVKHDNVVDVPSRLAQLHSNLHS